MAEQKMSSLVIRNGLIVTMNDQREYFTGDLYIEGREIKKVSRRRLNIAGAKVIDATDCFVIPGLIQAHTHLVQTLFRGDADDLALLDWLKKRIWPFEHAHTPRSIRASALLGLYEMSLSGTTAILDMATVKHTGEVFQAALESGMRYAGGKCLMDLKGSAGPLYEPFKTSVLEVEDLIEEWHGKTDLLRYAMCPRFAISCTEEMLRYSESMQREWGLLIHTHASENRDEVRIVKERTGKQNIDYFDHLGLLNSKTVVAHGIHLTSGEIKKVARSCTHIVHCPSSNLKLASGIAPITSYLKQGINIALGADGAPCNNSMDPFIEMRLAALLQKPLFGPEALPAQTAFELATLGGARALGQAHELGSLETGKLADVVVVKRDHPSVATVLNPYSALVYSCLGRDVRDVLVNGRIVVRNGEHQLLDGANIRRTAELEHQKLLKRA